MTWKINPKKIQIKGKTIERTERNIKDTVESVIHKNLAEQTEKENRARAVFEEIISQHNMKGQQGMDSRNKINHK